MCLLVVGCIILTEQTKVMGFGLAKLTSWFLNNGFTSLFTTSLFPVALGSEVLR